MDAHRLPADLAGEIQRLLRHAVPCQLQRVGCHAHPQRLEYLRRRPEITVRRHQPVNTLMGPLEVVMVDEEPDTPLSIAQVQEHRRLDALFPQRAPETLDLAKRLRMTWPRDDLLDATLLQLAAELTLAPPGHV